MVAFLNCAYVEKDRRFQVVQTFQEGAAALKWLLENPADLLILDVYMPRITGLEVLHTLRSREVETDAIMVTAANDAKTVNALLKLGVVDYLVKPFTQWRFQQALDTFCFRREAVAGNAVSQETLDHLVSPPGGGGRSAPPKGVQESTLERVRDCLRAAPEEGMSSEAIARQTGLSVVTARHYVNYLVERGEAARAVKYDTGGRPSRLYRFSGTPGC